ncbi:insulinase family protein [Pelagicoccus sp. SDUM812003]|uniref:M16 family metallopeptidase n=1 Tax=Pelagicoccus sp. SDUM812003 TaxID=3041267 RepID=UPI00280D044F|nr:insulinase family protein [Pelagicoccus sp. SDUM812003]MDQ8203193.1 insulinase family protein [Pelagicoccus sp. SDUM812003]
MRTRSLAIVVLLVAIPLSVFAAKRADWPHERSDISPDPSIVWGELENGFGYALKPHRAKQGIISMRLLVEVGSLDEKEDERGVAHFIEHMAFEGTRNFAPGELIAFFQRLGMSYGTDVNAFTYHDKTVYHLELPQKDLSLIRQGLRLFRDYSDGILFSEERVDTEREVISRERQARESPSALVSQESFRFYFDGTRLADRHPIGLQSVVKNVSREQLIEFYQKWYRPDLMTLVVVGDFDVESMQAEIETAFSSMEKPRGKPAKRKLGKLTRSKPFRMGSVDVAGVERFTLELSRPWDDRQRRDNWERRRSDALRSFATSIFNERCRSLIDGMSDNFATYSRIYDLAYCQLTISSGGEYWWEAFIWMDQLLRQATQHGFTPQELERLRENWLKSNRMAAARYETAEPRFLIDDLVDSIASDRVYAGKRDFFEQMQTFIEELKLEEVNAAFREVWESKRLAYFAAGDFKQPFDTDLLKARIKGDRKFVVMPYVPNFAESFQYSNFGTPGTVVEETELTEIGAKTFRFSNNARLTLMRTENEKDTVRALVRVGGGMLAFTDSNPGTHALAMPALFRSGFGNHDIEDVYQELRDNVSSFVFGVEDHDAFTYRALAPTDGLDEFLKIVAEYLLDPRVDRDAFELAQSKLTQSRELEPDGMNEGYRDLYRLIYPDQPRFHAPSLRDIEQVDPSEISAWLGDSFKRGYLEVALVGDVNEDEVVELVAQTLGALPMREDHKSAFDSARRLRVTPQTGKRLIEYQNGKGDNAASVIVWTIQEELTQRESAALYVLSSVLETRIREKVREEMGATYAPTVSYVTFSAYETLRHVRADIDCLKQDAGKILDAVLEISDELASTAISDDEVRKAVAPMEEGLRQAWKDNGYLLEHVLYGLQEYPEVLENAIRYRDGLLSSMTAEEVQAVAKRFLKRDQALAVAIVPAMTANLAERPVWSREFRSGASEDK